VTFLPWQNSNPAIHADYHFSTLHRRFRELLESANTDQHTSGLSFQDCELRCYYPGMPCLLSKGLVQSPVRDIPVLTDTDVLVIGGSPTGVAAAIGAAREGARVMLLERFGFLGGQMTAGLMLTIHRPFWDAHGRRIVGGVPLELIREVIRLGGTRDCFQHLEQDDDHFWGDAWTATALDPEVNKLALQKLVTDENIQLLLDCWVSDVVMSGNRATGAVIDTRQGDRAILASMLIDATGDAHVAALAGAGFMQRYPDQFAPNLVGRIDGFDPQTFADYVEQNYDNISPHPAGLGKAAFLERIRTNGVFGVIGFRELVQQAQQHELLDREQVRLGFLHTGDGHCMLWRNNLARVDCLDAIELSTAYVTGRTRLWQAVRFYREYVPGMHNIRMLETATAMGIRETRRIIGEYILNEDDVKQSKHFPDVICRSAGHDSHNDIRDGVVNVPLRSLIPKDLQGMLVAGRAISCTAPVALDSIRGVVPCMSSGQAAGITAAMSVQNHCQPLQLVIPDLQEKIRQQQVYFD
jgi:hypothetical protein